MKFSLIAATVALAASAFAAPSAIQNRGEPCLSDHEAHHLLTEFMDAFGLTHGKHAARETLDRILANNFQEISDSILSLEDKPLGTPSQTSKKVYIEGLIQQQPPTTMTTLLAGPINCNKILWQWVFQGIGGPGKQEVKGFNLFQVDLAARQIETLYVEFNSIAWALDTGYNVSYPFPTGPATTSTTPTPTPAPTTSSAA